MDSVSGKDGSMEELERVSLLVIHFILGTIDHQDRAKLFRWINGASWHARLFDHLTDPNEQEHARLWYSVRLKNKIRDRHLLARIKRSIGSEKPNPTLSFFRRQRLI